MRIAPILCILLAAPAAQAAPGIAYVNFGRVWTESAAGKQAESDLAVQAQRDAAEVAAAEKRKDPDAKAMRASLPTAARAEREAAQGRLMGRIIATAAKLRAERHLHEVRLVDQQTLSIEGDVSDEIAKRIDAEDQANAATAAANARAAKAEAERDELRQKLAGAAPPPK